MPDPADPEPDFAGGLAKEAAKWHLEDQLARFRGLLSRLPITSGLNSIIVGFFAVAFALLAPSPTTIELALAGIALAIFLLSVACTTVAMGKTLPHRGPTAEQVLEIEAGFSEDEARRWVVEQMSRAYQLNEPVLASMQRWSQAAQASAFVDAVFVVATVYVVLLG